jgi:hypothetical protein
VRHSLSAQGADKAAEKPSVATTKKGQIATIQNYQAASVIPFPEVKESQPVAVAHVAAVQTVTPVRQTHRGPEQSGPDRRERSVHQETDRMRMRVPMG